MSGHPEVHQYELKPRFGMQVEPHPFFRDVSLEWHPSELLILTPSGSDVEAQWLLSPLPTQAPSPSRLG